MTNTPRTADALTTFKSGDAPVAASLMAELELENVRLVELLEQMLNVAENADETGYVTDCGFVNLDKLHEEVRAALALVPEAALGGDYTATKTQRHRPVVSASPPIPSNPASGVPEAADTFGSINDHPLVAELQARNYTPSSEYFAVMHVTFCNQLRADCDEESRVLNADLSRTTDENQRTRLYQALAAIKRIRDKVAPPSNLILDSKAPDQKGGQP